MKFTTKKVLKEKLQDLRKLIEHLYDEKAGLESRASELEHRIVVLEEEIEDISNDLAKGGE